MFQYRCVESICAGDIFVRKTDFLGLSNGCFAIHNNADMICEVSNCSRKFGLISAYLRQITRPEARLRSGVWDDPPRDSTPGVVLSRNTKRLLAAQCNFTTEHFVMFFDLEAQMRPRATRFETRTKLRTKRDQANHSRITLHSDVSRPLSMFQSCSLSFLKVGSQEETKHFSPTQNIDNHLNLSQSGTLMSCTG